MSDIENVEPEKKGVSRRTVTKAMAWAVPVIAIATPVPAFAASGGPPGVAVGVACKLPGGSPGELPTRSPASPASAERGFRDPVEDHEQHRQADRAHKVHHDRIVGSALHRRGYQPRTTARVFPVNWSSM